MELESLRGDTIYFNEWFEEMCIKILNRPDITFDTFLNNMRPENQRWWDVTFDIDFIQYNDGRITKNIITHYARINPRNKNYPEFFKVIPKCWLQFSFHFIENNMGIDSGKLIYLHEEWGKIIYDYEDDHKIYFSSKLIKDYTLYCPDKKIKLKRRTL